ncbi:intermembrane transport protein PqiB [Castellaniella sp.]|uniref:PqiB family protein n=1 Tax=Castellaniella sp. TaxID=1955812 RepID=UPI003560740A
MTESDLPRAATREAGAPQAGSLETGGSGIPDEVQTPRMRPGRTIHWSWVWLVPLLALAVGLSLLASVWVRSGPVITISFSSAAGIEAGQTKLRYRNVVVGEVSAVRVAPDREHVLVDVQLQREGAEYITQKDAKFWVVEPRVSISGVTGLDTLISGVYLSVDAPLALSDSAPVHHFTGLKYPPEVISGQQGTRFVLVSNTLGSLRVGARVFYRRIDVGRVVAYDMADDGQSVRLQIFVEAPYDAYVTSDSRFWNDSGIDMTISANGVELRTSGLSAILDGGISFAPADEATTFDGVASRVPARPGTEFTLFETRKKALAEPDGIPLPIEMRFAQSVRGLQVGAGVEFRGMPIGEVLDIDLEYDARHRRFYTRVRANLYPMRFGQLYPKLVKAAGNAKSDSLIDPLVENGLCAQLKTANLLTGIQYVSLSFCQKDEIPAEIPGDEPPMATLVPTIPGEFDRLQQQIGSIVTKLDALPLEDIGRNLSDSLASLNGLLGTVDTKLVPELSGTLGAARRSLDKVGGALGPDAPIMGSLHTTMGSLQATMQQVGQAARALRVLADLLQAHPESLLRGLPSDTLR